MPDVAAATSPDEQQVLRKLSAAIEKSITDINYAHGADYQFQQFAQAFDPDSRIIQRLLAAVVKETLVPRRPSESASPSASLRVGSVSNGIPIRGGHSPSVDLDHVRSLMEAIEIVSPHMVGVDVAEHSLPDSRNGWSLPPGNNGSSFTERHSLVGSFGTRDSTMQLHQASSASRTASHRPSAQGGGAAHHTAGIPIRPSRQRSSRGSHTIDPIEFAEYAVAHMRPSPRFTPMGHYTGLHSSSLASDPGRSSLPRSVRGPQQQHHAINLPRQQGLDDMRQQGLLNRPATNSNKDASDDNNISDG